MLTSSAVSQRIQDVRAAEAPPVDAPSLGFVASAGLEPPRFEHLSVRSPFEFFWFPILNLIRSRALVVTWYCCRTVSGGIFAVAFVIAHR